MNAHTKGYLVIMGILMVLLVMSLAVYYVAGKLLGLIIFLSFIGGITTGLWIARARRV